ncbi:MAG: GGDEF and EAL domain-containing protein [Campylobacterota bacterium]|nr:GGDEF and EAL domain-containing protein [Campylobacterota bacterium]
MLPIIFITLFSIIIGSQMISSSLEKQISVVSKQEVENFGNKIYFSFRSNFKTLFFNFGENENRFKMANDAAQKESIYDLKQSLHNSDYIVFLKTPDKIVPLTTDTISFQDINSKTFSIEDENYFIYSRYFLPWQWQLIVLKDKTTFFEIIESNRNLIILNLAIFVLSIILLLAYILKRTIQNPFKKIFIHLDAISKGDYKEISLPLSKEINLLNNHINSMSSAISTREKELISERNTTKNIFNSQLSIVLVTNGLEILETNDSFFKFFNQYKNLREFKLEHSCICDFFEVIDEKNYIYKFSDRNWFDVLMEADTIQKVKMIKGDEEYIFNISGNSFKNDTTHKYVVTLTDITELEVYKEEIENSKNNLTKQLYTDTLTGMPNRLQLIEDISKNDTASLILINIDSFKEINDFFGHDLGDKVLIEFGNRIRTNSYLLNYSIYRLSADEFALYKAGNNIKEKSIDFIHKLSQYLNAQRYTISDNNIVFSTTIGSAINSSRSSLFINADIAIKTAKKNKKEIIIYDESLEMLQVFASNLEWVNKLKNAIDLNLIVPYFQPIYDNATGKISKFESLIRMLDSNGSPIAPFFFLDVAKKSHQYATLTEIMIEKSFEHFKDLDHTFSINLSATDILDSKIITVLIDKIKSYNIGHKLIIELLESEGIENYDAIAEFIQEIKQYGCKVAIDDFGSGFSNFQHRCFPNPKYNNR